MTTTLDGNTALSFLNLNIVFLVFFCNKPDMFDINVPMKEGVFKHVRYSRGRFV